LRPLDRDGVARVIEHGARLAGDAAKLSTHLRSIGDLLREADYWAGQAKRELTSRDHVQRAIDEQIRRGDRIRERIYENIERGTILIDTSGATVGQVNGLSVLQLGGFMFGQPSRITATTRLGAGKVVDIERETELGGPLHSKGVLILSSFLGARYAHDYPLSVAASLVFEQSYGGVDGDSASLAELCALLSSLSGLPIAQSFAITGSVNQHGQVQAIGGVNEKVEGFFDICKTKQLSGEQAVLIPAANSKHLMLRHNVVQAAKQAEFRIFPIATVDQAISLLTGVDAGERDAEGKYPENSVNGRVEQRLLEFSRARASFAKLGEDEGQQRK
jgi:predicted ATP-dependent protease